MARGDDRVALLWNGAAHYHIFYRGLRIVIDPLITRLPGDKPHLELTREDIDKIDLLLLTHGHLDHSWDFPRLFLDHSPETYAPADCIKDVRREAARRHTDFDRSTFHALEESKGEPFRFADIEVTAHQIGTEEIDFWFLREMFLRPWRHGRPGAVPTGLRWLLHHVFGNCFAYLFRLPPDDTTMLYFGNLTDDVDELAHIQTVTILAIPYCPANRKWLEQSQYLINRFRPHVTMVHHFDNFMNPFTLSKYMNLDAYRRALHEKCPAARMFFSKFGQEVGLEDIVKGETAEAKRL